jgi:hypothetical protein
MNFCFLCVLSDSVANYLIIDHHSLNEIYFNNAKLLLIFCFNFNITN